MGKFAVSCLALTAFATQVLSFSSPATDTSIGSGSVSLSLSVDDHEHSNLASRADFLRSSSSIVAAATSVSLMPIDPAVARGRATLEQAYDRYSARIIDGGNFYKSKLKVLIAKEDYAAIKAALQEPPKKTRADRAKIDGGIQERAAQAGEFSDARVLVALDLLAAQFSDNSISPKTKAMKKDVDEIRSVVTEMTFICRQALGEESSGGGFLGLGKKQTSKKELSNRMKELYIIGGTAWNRYAFVANEGIPKTLQQLPTL
mmetsp:Transcript_23946/g.50925  ORF Transcript_23946/g.50925 Transcript_23946/m.50925 type:complete len:260 (+) Transcript_23946:33-812(+)|eukprot:CAMPEP_0201117318 /NCGR_PEP_ID=MMETSP0850-20130426/1296_1 /ASSEMBLY_ACC=CAM_ASM_000622 /TAXON_ID=183588 /ORGANISM="Pseudo-nitzschia fraudulenta, Strain WWA7" /LENGTH=259 /DNA_ID=CAMNT_0047381575 /DNA_START=18 /DNA_END=797 /DNA_ORIENTATION=+